MNGPFLIFALIVVVVLVVGIVIYRKIMNRGKKCPYCGEKYDSSCIVDAQVASKSYGGQSSFSNPTRSDYTDVNVKLKCKKCGKINDTQVTLRSSMSEIDLTNHLKRHFDK